MSLRAEPQSTKTPELAIVTRGLPNPEVKHLRTIVLVLAVLVLVLFVLVFTTGS